MNKSIKLSMPKTNAPILPSYLHWYEISDGFIITKEGYLQKTFELELPSNNASDQKVNEVCTSFTRWLNTLPGDITLNFEVSHYLPEESLYENHAASMEGAASLFEQKRAEGFASFKAFVNEHLLTLVFKPTFTENFELSKETISSTNKFIDDMKINLSVIGINIRALSDDEMITYLHSTISPNQVKLSVPQLGMGFDLDHILADTDIIYDTRPLKLGKSFIKVLTINGFSSIVTMSAMLESLCSANVRIRWVSRFKTMNNEQSIKFVNKKHKKFIDRQKSLADVATGLINQEESAVSNVQELSKADECAVCAEVLAETGMNIGIYSGFIVVESSDEKELEEEIAKIRKSLQGRGGQGVLVKDEDLALFSSWLGSLPGNLWHGYRQIPITTQNFADLIRLSVPYRGNIVNEHLKELTGVGTPLLYGTSPDGTICYFSPNSNSNSKDVGHTVILGKTGSGKSILLGAMAASFLKYPNSRVILFDKDASALTNFTINQKGTLYRPLIDDTVFQPLQNSKQNISRCMRFLEALCSVQNIKLDANDRDELAKTLSLIPDDHMTLSVFSSLIKGRNHDSKVVAALENYTASGTYGGIFDSDHDTFSSENFGRVTCIETTALMHAGDVCIIPALSYIFSQLEKLFTDRKPTLLVLDEAWEYLKHPYFASTIQEWLRTLRKLNVFVIIATQEISSVPKEALKTVMASVNSTILLPTSGADNEVLRPTYESIGVTSEEINLIANVLKPRKHYLIKQGNNDCLIIDFHFTKEQLDLFTGQNFREES